MKQAFDQSKLLLSVTISVPESFDFSRFDLAALSNAVQFINFVHDYSWLWSGANDAVKWLQISNAQNKIEKLIELGVSPTKIVMGIHLTGMGFKHFGGTLKSTYRYVDVCNAKKKTFDANCGLTFLVKNHADVVIESSRSIANKVRFAMKRGLLGVAPIYMPFDDYLGICKNDNDTFADFEPVVLNIPNRTDNTFPLLHTISEAMDLTLGEMGQKLKPRTNILVATPVSTSATPESSTVHQDQFGIATSIVTPNPNTTQNKVISITSTTPKTTATEVQNSLSSSEKTSSSTAQSTVLQSDETTTQSTSEATSESISESTSEATSESTSESTSETTSEATSETTPETIFTSNTESTSEKVSELISGVTSTPTPRPGNSNTRLIPNHTNIFYCIVFLFFGTFISLFTFI